MRKIDRKKPQGATSDTGQINRRIALNYIRRHTPVSRADLARRAGLRRGTVSAVVDELIEQGWVTEGAIGPSPRGGRPRFLHLNVERTRILAVELRPEVTTIGLAGVDGRFVEQISWSTPHTPEAFVRKLARTVATMQRAHPRVVWEGIGISLPGRVDSTGRLVFAPNLRWGDADLASLIAARHRPASRARERCQCVRAGRAVVRSPPREHPTPPCGHRVGRHRRRAARERAAPARRPCYGW